MTANPAGSKLGIPSLGRRPAVRACLTTAVFVLALATLGSPAAWADDPVPPTATTSVEPTPEATSTGSAAVSADASEPATEDPPSGEPTAVPEVPTSQEPDGDDSGPIETGIGGGEGGGPAPSTAEEGTGTEPAPVEEGTLAAAAEDVRDPRASIGDVDCTNLKVPVTLDNSRSTEAVAYLILAGDAAGDGPTFEETVPGAAGEIRIMNLSVTEDTLFAVYVYEPSGEDYLSDRILAFAVVSVDCTADDDAHDPQARIGGLDCVHLTLDVTLDNSRSEDETSYLVTAISLPDEEQTYEQMFTVPSGGVQTVTVPVNENSTVGVIVGDKDVLDETEGDEGNLALELFRVDCTPGDEPRASIGEVNCTNLTVPLILDNTRSAVETTFTVVAFAPESDEYFENEDYFAVAAGAERSVAVPLLDHAKVVVIAADGDKLFQGDALAYETFDVDCVRVFAGRAGPRLADGTLAATGANGLMLPMTGLTLLTCGGVLSMLGRRHT
jgi:hypothetical protein